MKLLVFLTVAPMLYWGISLIADESFLSGKLHRVLIATKGRSFGNSHRINPDRMHPGRTDSDRMHPGSTHSDLITAIVTSLLLVIVGLFYFTWKNLSIFWIYLATAGICYSFLNKGKARRARRKWQMQVDMELPGLTQALTLMISAGVSPMRAMQVISSRSDSVGAKELRLLVSEVLEGKSTVRAIDDFARRVESFGSRRFSNALSIAIERGTPLVPVLTALLKDAQVDSKNELLRRAGKAEIALMLPVVFLLLPISVLFALFPSVTQLQVF